MKKALAILLALSMVFAAFADAPVVSNSVAEFKGDASLEWVYDLQKEESGFKNSANANLKIDIVSGGDASTSGDGIWGELKIKVDGTSINNGALTATKDYQAEAQDWVNGLWMPSVEKNADGKYDAKIPYTGLYPSASVDVAKIHFVDGDFGVALNLKAPDLNLGKAKLPTATGASFESSEFDPDKNVPDGLNYDGSAKYKGSLTNGFAIELTSADFDANLKVKDNGLATKKEYGFAGDVTVKAIENANFRAAFAYADDTTAMRFGADYKYAIDEKLYVKPVVDFTMMDKAKALVAGALFGWGTEEQEPGLGFDKCADGVSVAFYTDLAEKATQKIAIGAYDSTFVEGLKAGVQYEAALDAFGKGTLKTGASYSTDVDILTISAKVTYSNDLSKKTDGYGYEAKVETDDIIDNTTVYGKYEGGKDNKGKITVGAKIAL